MPIIVGIITIATIPNRTIKITIRAKCEGATLVIPKRMWDFNQNLFISRISLIRVILGNLESRNHTQMWRMLHRVIGKEFAILFIIRMEGKTQKPLFIFLVDVTHLRTYIQKDLGFLSFGIIRNQMNLPLLHSNNNPIRAIARIGNNDRPQRLNFTLVIHFLPTRPLHIGKCRS